MTTVTATASNSVAGTTAIYTIGFTMASDTVIKSVDMAFDSNFDVSSATLGTVTCTAGGTDFTPGARTIAGQTVTYTVTAAAPDAIDAGGVVAIPLNGIVNPSSAGTYTDAVTVTIKDTDGTTIDTGTADVIITTVPEVWVDVTNGLDSNPGTEASPFETIQKGIDEAVAYGTVNVGPGTYDLSTDTLRANKAGITVRSTAGELTTIIDADSVTGGPAVEIHASDVTFQGFTVAMDGDNMDGFWIWYGTSGVTVHNNTITEAGWSGIALTYGSTTAFVTDATVTDNNITDCVTGIDVGGCLHDSLISNNTITGCDAGGRGINFAGGWLASDATKGGLTEGNTISNNTISNLLCMGIFIKENSSAVGSLRFDDNLIDDNDLSGNAKGGIIIGNASQALVITNLSITHNDITNNEVAGIQVDDSVTWGAGNVINNNNIYGNVAYGIENAMASPVIDAENNWWGDASGPYHSTNSAATGDEVTNLVDYRPWLTAAYDPGATLDTWGVFRAGTWYLDITGDGDATDTGEEFDFGNATDVPLVGDWSGTGTATWGVFRAGTWYLDKNGDGNYAAPGEEFTFGLSGDTPLVGDFNVNGTGDTWGVWRAGVWSLDKDGDGTAETVFVFGNPTDTPLVGDWGGTAGTDTWGVWRAGVWYLDKNGDGDASDIGEAFVFGNPTDTPLVGDWGGTAGTDTWGVWRAGAWFLDKNGDGDAADTGEAFVFGNPTGDIALVGNWGSGSAAPTTQAASAAGWYAMCFPNPASTGDAVTFRMMGAGVNAVKVSVYDLGGGLVYQSNFETGRSLTWDLYSEGAPVANGIYLYSMIAKANGELIETEIGKLLILR